eukprot:XP_014769107.1 PREDICTED: protein fuzzy homolog [Octopus bimaculoides]
MRRLGYNGGGHTQDVAHRNITLILITDDYSISDCHIGNFLRIIFNVVVFFCGQEDVANIKNPERFKNEIKVCFKLIDDLMNQMSSATFSAMTNTVEIITGPDCIPLQVGYIQHDMVAVDKVSLN